MGLIANNVFSGIADRLAGQGQQLKAAINSGQNTGTKLYPRIHTGVPTLGDFAVENALINSAHAVDINTISGTLFQNVYATFIQDLETHTLNNNAVSFDSWLNTSGINVHPEFEDIYFQVKSSHLDSRNVFFAEENILAGTYAAVSSGTGTFTAGTDVGTGAGKVSSTNHAAAKMVLVPVNDVSADIEINVQLVSENLAGGTNTDSDNIAISSGTASGVQFAINNSDPFLSVSNILAAGGASGNHFRVYALRERELVL